MIGPKRLDGALAAGGGHSAEVGPRSLGVHCSCAPLLWAQAQDLHFMTLLKAQGMRPTCLPCEPWCSDQNLPGLTAEGSRRMEHFTVKGKVTRF